MVDVAVVTPQRVPAEWLAELVGSRGGTSKEGPPFFGMIQKGRVRVEIDLEGFEAYAPEYVSDYAKRLGFNPVSAVALHYGPGARSLAMSIAEEVRAAWGGTVVTD